MDEYIDDIAKTLDFSNTLNNYNGLILSKKEVEVLDNFNINYIECSNMKDLLFLIEEELELEENKELEEVSISISDRDYYMSKNH